MATAEVAGERKPVVGAVEVQKDGNSRMWWSAHVVDIVGKKLLVGFDSDVWPKEEFSYACVRKVPRLSQAEGEKFSPRIGDEVELRLNATEHHPAGWSAAVVKNIKHSFFFVASRGSGGDHEAIVEKAMLRPPSTSGGLESQAESLKQESFKFAPSLRDWVDTEDAVGCFARVEADAGLVFIKISRTELKLAGDPQAVRKAKMLLDVHQKHQMQIQAHMEKREKRLGDLEKRRNRIEGTGYQHSVEISIDASFVPRVIGAKGEAIRSVMQKYEVNIHIPDPEPNSRDETRIIRIFGNSMENIEKARGEVEFIEEAYPEPIDQAMFNWVRGRGGRTINTLKELTGIVYARMDRDTRQLFVCGTRNAVEDAMALFETHMMYYPVFSQMDEEMEELVKQLEEFGDYSARKEWAWYRDDDWESYGYGGYGDYGGRSSGSGSKGGKSKGGAQGGKDSNKGNKGNNKDRADGKESGKENKDSKGKGKESKGKSKGWEDEESKPATNSSKDGGKGSWKSGKNSKANNWHQEEEPEEEEEEEAWPERARGKGRGRSSRGGTPSKQEDAIVPATKPAANRKMGKKGLRQ